MDCIYCGIGLDAINESESHLFPQSIGGRFKEKHCCCHCNNWLGHSLESKLLRCLFFAFGRDKLGISSKEEAFRDFEIVDPTTGEDYKYVGEELLGKAKMRSPTIRIAPPKELRRLINKDLKRRQTPDYLIADYMRKFDEGAEQISIPGVEHEFRKEELHGTVEFRGDPFPTSVLAKICFEIMLLSGAFTLDFVYAFHKSVFDVFRLMVPPFRTRIEIKEEFRQRGRLMSPGRWRGNVDYSAIHYQPSHSIDMRVTPTGLAYIGVNFFEVLRYMVVVGQVANAQVANQQFLSVRMQFPIDNRSLVRFGEYPDEYLHMQQAEDVFAGIVWKSMNE